MKKTNLLYLYECKKVPCRAYLALFEKNETGNLFVWIDEAFAKYGQQYEWLYENTRIDYISWEIEQNRFDWEKYSWAVAKFCPQNFNSELFNWRDYSWAVAEYCSQFFNREKFNWKKDKWAVEKYCPQYLD